MLKVYQALHAAHHTLNLAKRISKTSFLTPFLFCHFLMLLSLCANAQVKTPLQQLDSILMVNKAHPREDSIKLIIYKAIYRQYLKIRDKEKADAYISKSITLARRLNLRSLEGDAYYRRALGYHGVANYQQAETNYLLAIAAYTAANNIDMIAGTYLNMGALYQGIPDYAKALEFSQKAIAIYQKNGNESDLASVYANISDIYKDLGQQATALNYLNKALKIFLADNSDRGVAVVYNSIGSTYLSASDQELAKMGINPDQKYERALENLNKGIKVALVLGDESVLGPLYKNLGIVYERTYKNDLALQAFVKAIDYANKVDNKTDLGYALLELAKFYTQDNDNAKALKPLQQALAIGQKDKTLDIQKDAYLLWSTINEKQGNYNESLVNYKKYIAVRDQIFNEEKEKEITRKQLQIDFAVKEKDYQLKQQVTDAELQRQFLLAKQQQQQLILRQQQLALSDKEKSLQRLTFLQKQSELENEKLLQANVLRQQETKAQLDQQLRDKQIDLQKSQLRFNKNVNLFLGLLLTVLFAVGLFVFYSQRKAARLNKIVSEQKQELEKLGRVKDRIFSVVSHDMRSPVNSLISFIQLLEDGNISQDKLSLYAGSLKNNLGYTSAMMENLLNWASSQMQGFKPLFENFNLNSCAGDVINTMVAIAAQKDIQIENHIHPQATCFADQNMTSLVLRNLISNAIKFTPNKGIIELNSALNNQEVLIAVSDSGIGLSEQQVAEFNRFGYHETIKTTFGTNREKGTGIGLVLCKTFVTMMNGSLKVKSTPNHGSTFTLFLPASSVVH